MEKEIVNTDVLFIGGGVASLSGALRLSNLVNRHNEQVEKSGTGEKLEDFSITLLEKGAYPGAHGISGAVMDPGALAELIPDYEEKGAPLDSLVNKESVQFLTKNKRIRFPFTPPMLNNHGNYVVSMSKLIEWLADLAEQNEVDIYPEFAGTEILFDGDQVIGVGTGDRGIDKNGEAKPNLEPGINLRAKVTVFGDGSRGNLTTKLVDRLRLNSDKNPQSYVVGVKEVWRAPKSGIQAGEVIHTLGYPLSTDTYGGGFVYGMKDDYLTLGLLIGLDYKNPLLDPHREFQRMKRHPIFKKLLKDGSLIQWGAKTTPVGGLFSVPELVADGALIIGDAGGLFVSQKLKGIHTAIQSGIIAAETIFAALSKNDFSKASLKSYQDNLLASETGKELRRSRNWHQAFNSGMATGMIKGGIQYILGGRIIRSRLPTEPDFIQLNKVCKPQTTSLSKEADFEFDGTLTFNKETGVYHSGTLHEEDQPLHLKIKDLDICTTRCVEEFQNPCLRFCPANVYETRSDAESQMPELILNPSNCVHCKTCDIKDPYQNIEWTPPEGGGGPKYTIA